MASPRARRPCRLDVADEAVAAAKQLPGPVYVVKSQIHAGGRGAGRFKEDPNGKGGVRVVKSIDDVKAAAEAMIGKTLVTKQSSARPARSSPASMWKMAATSSASSISACWSIARPRA